jgi:hypothetical protein
MCNFVLGARLSIDSGVPGFHTTLLNLISL